MLGDWFGEILNLPHYFLFSFLSFSVFCDGSNPDEDKFENAGRSLHLSHQPDSFRNIKLEGSQE